MARQCLDSFATFDGGIPRVYAAGEMYADDDDAVTKHPEKFEDPDSAIARRARLAQPVEATTAAPGEKRSTRIPKGTTRKTKDE